MKVIYEDNDIIVLDKTPDVISDEFPNKAFSQNAIRKLMLYDYPGNVRELQNIITRAALISDAIIEDVELRESKSIKNAPDIYTIPDEGINLDHLEKTLIENTISKVGGNKSKAAQLLGLTRRRLYSMMERFGIEY